LMCLMPNLKLPKIPHNDPPSQKPTPRAVPDG
jgi:hypothetical protein